MTIKRSTFYLGSNAAYAWRLGFVFLMSLILLPAYMASRHTESHQSILQEKGEIRLMLIDATTSQPIANTNVELHEIVFCRKAPCPPMFLWSHNSDSDGIVQPPHKFVTDYVLVGTEKYVPREIRFATWNVDKQVWMINLTQIKSR